MSKMSLCGKPDSHRTVELAAVVTAGRHTLDWLDSGGGHTCGWVVVIDHGAEAGDEVEDVLFLVTGQGSTEPTVQPVE
jgi:hypothetical protein